jgi:hypothetical protein
MVVWSLIAVLLTITALAISLITIWTDASIAHWIVYLVVGFLGAFCIVLLIKEIFFTDPYATWPALISVIGISVALFLTTTLPMFFHLSGRIDHLSGRIGRLYQ